MLISDIASFKLMYLVYIALWVHRALIECIVPGLGGYLPVSRHDESSAVSSFTTARLTVSGRSACTREGHRSVGAESPSIILCPQVHRWRYLLAGQVNCGHSLLGNLLERAAVNTVVRTLSSKVQDTYPS